MRSLSVLIIFLVSFSASAEKKRIAFLSFSGDKGASFRKQVYKKVKRRYKMVSRGSYFKKAKQMDASRLTKDNIAKVAPEVGADGIIVGRVRRKDGQYSITIVLRSGTTGEIVKKVSVRSRSLILKDKTLRTIDGRLFSAARKLEKAEVPEEEPEEEEPEEEEPEEVEQATDDDDPDAEEEPRRKKRKKKRRKKKRLLDDEGQFAAIALLGGKFGTRSVNYNQRVGTANPVADYPSGLISSLALELDLYPLAFADRHSPASGIGISVGFDKALGIGTSIGYNDNGTQAVANVGTSYQSLTLGLLYRIRINEKIFVRLSAQYRKDDLAFDLASLPAGVSVDLPSIAYSAILPGVRFGTNITPDFTLAAEVSAFLPLSAGDYQLTTEFGGASSVFGVEGGAFFEYRISQKIPLRFGGGASMIGYTFDGTGDKTKNRNGDGTVDVGGARDLTIFGGVSIGYRY